MKKSEIPTTENRKLRVLIAPLDWGLGHSTRCIPIIKELKSYGCEVYIVADKKVYSLLKKEFPQTIFLRHKGYEIKYSHKKIFFIPKLFIQIPGILLRIFQEKKWLQKTIKKYDINAIISDNRFGMHNKNIPSVYITHQLFIKTGNRFIERIAQQIHYHFIRKYSVCWVPDIENNGLGGELSHPKNSLPNVIYIGPVSRFSATFNYEVIYDLLIIISGPEPQRTIFEKKIFKELKTVETKIFVVRGLPGENKKLPNLQNVTIENHLAAKELNEILLRSKMVLCRSGYTSVMDLTVLQKKAILIPTPGQTEQEYLSKYLMEKKYFFSMQQKDFTIKKALGLVSNFNFNTPNISPDAYKKNVHEIVLFFKEWYHSKVFST